MTCASSANKKSSRRTTSRIRTAIAGGEGSRTSSFSSFSTAVGEFTREGMQLGCPLRLTKTLCVSVLTDGINHRDTEAMGRHLTFGAQGRRLFDAKGPIACRTRSELD